MKKMILMTALAGAFGYSILPSFGLRHCQSLRRRKNNEGRPRYVTQRERGAGFARNGAPLAQRQAQLTSRGIAQTSWPARYVSAPACVP